jgi:hypothetical protein
MATLDDPFGSNTGHTKKTPKEKNKVHQDEGIVKKRAGIFITNENVICIIIRS